MARLITTGRSAQLCARGRISGTEDREEAVRKLAEAVGDSESLVAACVGASAAGTISNASTVRACTGAELKPVAENARKVAGAYGPPGSAIELWAGTIAHFRA